MEVSVQTEDFDPQAVVDALCKGRKDIGALVTFVGLVRDSAQSPSLTAMELEHYPGMTEKALEEIANEAHQRWSLQGASIIHRVGKLLPAERIVMVAVASMHRSEAFQACEFIMDFLKTRAPFWKKEHTAGEAHWVDARERDVDAQARWQ
ncbi:MAG: molybdenum cofactor biosynthesis protein MoaE [Halieaceae bacterium]|nr:molybdenum cofactor biosynthesis protein MoaE [Halieaceae bacterium]